MTDEQAEAYIKGRAAVEQSIMQLRLKHLPAFRNVLSGKSAALFFQNGLASQSGHGSAVGVQDASH
jgi:hypothetical protein